jgi:hypothetical protein
VVDRPHRISLGWLDAYDLLRTLASSRLRKPYGALLRARVCFVVNQTRGSNISKDDLKGNRPSKAGLVKLKPPLPENAIIS